MTPSRTTQIYTGNIIIFNNNDEGWGSAPGVGGSRGHVGQEGLKMKNKNHALSSCTFLHFHCMGKGFNLNAIIKKKRQHMRATNACASCRLQSTLVISFTRLALKNRKLHCHCFNSTLCTWQCVVASNGKCSINLCDT